MALNRCSGCGRSAHLYFPECGDCNIRFAGLTDWLRLNYATWPTNLIPEDHRYLVNEGPKLLRKIVKDKFKDPHDPVNRARAFLLRDNALARIEQPTNPHAATMKKLREEERERYIRALLTPFADKTMEEIVEERPELRDGEEYTVIYPSTYKKNDNNDKNSK
uniref:Uncharacterized protein n=1 Tax=Bracon brevicornis TaxID=1563983 RepID=A0A6V7HK86_9HYME